MGIFSISQQEVAVAIEHLETLKDRSYSDFKARNCLEAVVPTVLKLRDGQFKAEKVRNYVNSRNPAKAIEFLQGASRRRHWLPF